MGNLSGIRALHLPDRTLRWRVYTHHQLNIGIHAMILFAADNHYGTRPGATLLAHIKDSFPIRFFEDDWSCFHTPPFPDDCELLILNMIAGTGDTPSPGAEAEAGVRAYVEGGGNMLLLHGSSAAFWHWDWWRPLVGFRWVRGNDADGFEPSTHPKRPFRLDIAKCRHELCNQLQAIDLPEDEIYINLEQTCPTTVLMTTTTDEGTFPQCYECTTSWGGTILGYLPGHRPDVVGDERMVANCRVLIEHLLRP